MKVSIITVCFNSSKTILKTINSVNQQSYSDIEHIFIDGLSNDNTLDIIKLNSTRKKIVISEKDDGLYHAMNKGLMIVTGDLIGILNSDDFLKNKLVIDKIVKEFKFSGSDMVYGNIDYINNDGNIVRFWKSNKFKIKSFKKGWHPPHPSLFVKKTIYKKYGVFNTDFNIAADFELMLRFFERYSLQSSYLNYTIVTMLAGGVSNTFVGILKGRSEIMKAFKKNKIRPSFFYLIQRYLPKLIKILTK